MCFYRIYRDPEIIFFKDEGRQPFEILPDDFFGYFLKIPDACDIFEIYCGRDFFCSDLLRFQSGYLSLVRWCRVHFPGAEQHLIRLVQFPGNILSPARMHIACTSR
jgi:hypothetical protein